MKKIYGLKNKVHPIVCPAAPGWFVVRLWAGNSPFSFVKGLIQYFGNLLTIGAHTETSTPFLLLQGVNDSYFYILWSISLFSYTNDYLYRLSSVIVSHPLNDEHLIPINPRESHSNYFIINCNNSITNPFFTDTNLFLRKI